MKGPIIYSVAVTILAVAAIGALAVFLVSGAFDDQPQAATATTTPGPTHYDPSLTSSEAAAKAKGWIIDRARITGATDEVIKSLQKLNCDGRDFNTGDRAWIVVCQFAEATYTLRVYDELGLVEIVR
ncbi:MAG: hypothetical protein E6J43_13420 [Chloroflexi bacterium]|nr:MAG: hypothetical protein E6J43_13420 [Chloroflexota bacterium]